MDIAPRPPPDPAFNRDPAFIDALVRLYPAFIRGPAFIRRRRLIEEIRYISGGFCKAVRKCGARSGSPQIFRTHYVVLYEAYNNVHEDYAITIEVT